jgi:hypothetical protein
MSAAGIDLAAVDNDVAQEDGFNANAMESGTLLPNGCSDCYWIVRLTGIE